mgnify:CR=1 FL=1
MRCSVINVGRCCIDVDMWWEIQIHLSAHQQVATQYTWVQWLLCCPTWLRVDKYKVKAFQFRRCKMHTCHTNVGTHATCHTNVGTHATCHTNVGTHATCHTNVGTHVTCHTNVGTHVTGHTNVGIHATCHTNVGTLTTCHTNVGTNATCHTTLMNLRGCCSLYTVLPSLRILFTLVHRYTNKSINCTCDNSCQNCIRYSSA